MKLTEQINHIIDCRIGRNGYEGKGHLEIVQRKKAFFGQLSQIVNKYASLRETILAQIKQQKGEYYALSLEDPMFVDRIEIANPSDMLLQIQRCMQECERLEKRFNRESINISVIGRARQGKSRLLQSISGLSDEVIPASNGGDCTGAKSVIANKAGKTHAKVIFYNEVELIEQVQKYLDAVGINRHIGSVAQIQDLQSDIDQYASVLNTKTGSQQSLFYHLRKYVEHYVDYAHFIGTSKDNVSESEIRNYVAQYDAERKPTFVFLAVKEVEIYTQFPIKDAEQIVLVDTIGLGDTSLGIREKMIRTLRDDSDAAILVRLPSANGDGIRVEDDELYDLICEAMGTEALNKWLFFALNVAEVLHNSHAGDAMEKALKDRKLNYAFVQKVDCGNSKAVEQDLMLPILEYLIANLGDVDANLMQSANTQFSNAYQTYFDLCRKVQNVLSDTMKQFTSTGGVFDELYDQLNLSTELKRLNAKYTEINEKKCVQLLDDIQGVTRRMSDYVPSEDYIAKQIAKGDINADYSTVYNHCAHNLRSLISDEFERVTTDTLYKLQEHVKQEIIQILRHADGGKLGAIYLLNADENSSDIDWLKALITEKLGSYPLIEAAMRYIVDYRINMEGLIEYKVNKCLAILNPSNALTLSIDWAGIESEEEAVDYIQQTLLNAVGEFSSQLYKSLTDILAIPYNSFDTRIRKFREKIIFSKDGQKELRNLYRDNCAAIWHDEFAREIQRQTATGDWSDYTEELMALCKKEKFIA